MKNPISRLYSYNRDKPIIEKKDTHLLLSVVKNKTRGFQ
jgi:hypothetical protein